MHIFKVISALLSAYSLICFFRIILTWISGFSYGRFYSVLAKLCDPYLNLFRGIRWLRIGSFDFSPALALCILGAGASLFSMLGNGGTVSFPMLVAFAVEIAYTIVSSLITFIIILFAVRLAILLFSRDSYGTGGFMANQIDSSISPFVYSIARIFSLGRRTSYKTALIISIITLIFVQIALRLAVAFITGLLF